MAQSIGSLFSTDTLIQGLTNAGYAVSIADAQQPDLPLIFVNQVFSNLTGYTPEEVIGKNCRFLQDETTSQTALKTIREAIQSHSTCQVQLTNTTKSGRRYLSQLTLFPVFDDNHKLTYYLGFQRDLSAQDNLSRSLETLHENLQAIFSSMSEGVVIQNHAGEIIEANAAAQSILGLDLEQLMGKTSIDPSWRTVHEDGSPYPGEFHPSMRVLKTGKPILKEIMGVYKPDGSIRWIQINSQPIIHHSDSDNSNAVVTTFSDITHLREIESSLRHVNFELLQKIESLNVLSKSFEQAQQIASLGHWILESASNRLVWSDEVYRIFGVEPQSFEATFEGFMKYVHPEDRDALNHEYLESIEQKRTYNLTHRIIREDGRVGFVQERGFHDFDAKGEIVRSVGTVTDITEQHRKDFEIDNFVNLVNNQVIMSRTDLTGKIIEVSDFFCQVSGYSREELIGQNQNIVRHPDSPKRLFKELWNTIQSGKTWQGEIKNLRKDGSFYWVESRVSPDYDHLGNHTGYISLRLDITAQKALEEVAIKDEMTGLYNRRHYNHMLHKEIQRAKRQGLWLCFIMIDADNFKKYNDTYGHQAGDEVLKQIAHTMQRTFKRAGDLSFRLGGEEFAVLFEVEHKEDGLNMSEKIRQAMFDLNIEHSGNLPWLRVTLSIGALLMNPKQTYVEEEIYKYADEALYKAKANGRNRVELVNEHDVELF
ncbi:sensor domain-containing diguanylate cyclase [Thiomicrorhabdus chilensis]|uniref:sensor domain-containing diguanylate cyclase n=1 Tax=Thiomicrorhabdus chilensis TaxID=63656 RepID=UPI0003F58999|nr:PAS domain S-box protein [Thiomicrorhabdus chilensis]